MVFRHCLAGPVCTLLDSCLLVFLDHHDHGFALPCLSVYIAALIRPYVPTVFIGAAILGAAGGGEEGLVGKLHEDVVYMMFSV